MESQEKENQVKTKWYHFVFAFLAGVFIVNTLPHLINGVTGREFPTPFAEPPGKGLSSPTLNVLWAAINFVLGFIFLNLGKVSWHRKTVLIILLLGFFAMAFYLASYFGTLFNSR